MATLISVNPSDSSFTRHRFALWFGACGATKLLVWANCLEDAFDEAVDWIADHAPGLLCDELVEDAYQDAVSRGMSHDDAMDKAMSDVSVGGNHGHYVLSYEWGIIAEDPDRATVLELQGRG